MAQSMTLPKQTPAQRGADGAADDAVVPIVDEALHVGKRRIETG
jgi:hypothetical protein